LSPILLPHASHTHPLPHSLPTRRSSDLNVKHHYRHSKRVRQAWLRTRPILDAQKLGAPSGEGLACDLAQIVSEPIFDIPQLVEADRKSTRLNSSHVAISYAVFCLKKKIK